MDTRTGELYDMEQMDKLLKSHGDELPKAETMEKAIKRLPKAERKHFVPVKRDLTEQERCDHQVKLYNPCACGSGKKFKFCCHRISA